MARLNTKELIIKVSKLQKDNEEDDVIVGTETMEQLEAIISELVGKGVLVEIGDSTNKE
jgi:hypothetical protein